jgi:hypothetical protein
MILNLLNGCNGIQKFKQNCKKFKKKTKRLMMIFWEDKTDIFLESRIIDQILKNYKVN